MQYWQLRQIGQYRILKTIALYAALTTTATGWAQEDGDRTGLEASVEATVSHDDNARKLSNPKEDRRYSLTPNISTTWKTGPHQLDVSYEGRYVEYEDDTDLNYTDHALSADLSLQHGRRLSTKIAAGYRSSQDNPATSDTPTNAEGELAEWERGFAQATVTYGQTKSQGQLVFSASRDSYRLDKSNLAYRDYDRDKLVGTFYYRISDRTRTLFEIQRSENDHPDDNNAGVNQSNQTARYLTGISWEASELTTGTLKVGFLNREYDDDGLEDVSGLALSLTGAWTPTARTKVTIGGSHDVRSSTRSGEGGVVHSAVFTAVERKITSRTTLTLNLVYDNLDYDTRSRKDSRYLAGLDLTRSITPRLDIIARYRFSQRTSDDPLLEFESNQFGLSLRYKDR